MDEENELVSYMTKLQNMVDYLARGGTLQDFKRSVIVAIVNNEGVKKRNAFSIQEYDMYDDLEVAFYGEQRSIGILMEYINEGAYEAQVEGKIDFEEPYDPTPENAEFYERVMKRIKAVLKLMSLFLISGSHILLGQKEFENLKETYFGEEELDEYEEETQGYIIYDIENEQFSLMNLEGEVIIEYIDIDIVMEIYNQQLLRREQDELYRQVMEKEKESKRKLDQEERE